MTPDDRFYGASLAKQVTGASTALLVRDERLDPDAPVASYLDGLPRWSADITARQLAHHISGLPVAPVAETALEWQWNDARVDGYLAAVQDLPGRPGGAYGYSNLGYILLARIVARISGGTFADFVSREVHAEPGFGFVYDISGFAQLPHLNRPPHTHGDGGLWTSAPAFARWLERQNKDALGVASIVEAHGRLNDGTVVDYGWGLGLRRWREERLLIHGGEWRGASARAVRCPALGLACVALSTDAPVQHLVALNEAMLDGMENEDSPRARPSIRS